MSQIIKTDHIINDQKVSYSIEENGYTIYLSEKPWITQPEPHIPYPDLGYEGSCLKQIEELVNAQVQKETEEEKMAALEAQVQSLTDCILEMSGMLYA